MPDDHLADDDYVANLLKEDAKKTTQKYEMVGLGAYLPKRSAAPKPNTRFLRHIIRETDSHNAALLAKEAEESRARLRHLEKHRNRGEKRKDIGRLSPPDMQDYKKRRSDRGDDITRGRRREIRKGYSDDKRSISRSRERGDSDRHRITRSRHESDEERQKRALRRSKSSRDADRRHRRNSIEDMRKSHRKDEEKSRNRSHRRRRSRSRSFSTSPAPPKRSRKHGKSSRRHRDHRSSESPCNVSPETRRTDKQRRSSPPPKLELPNTGSDSDPLEAIVGPVPLPPHPAVRSRGRGVKNVNSMAMDARFSSTYDPHADIDLNSDIEDDWGDALEALRDRQRWKQQGGDRLRAAGFTDDQVKKWERGDEKNEDDVTWSKNGEAREWDRGKVVGDDGDVTLKADWGRLK